jgi:hypothetical protein
MTPDERISDQIPGHGFGTWPVYLTGMANDLESFRQLVVDLSEDADLAVVGFDLEGLSQRGKDVFTNQPSLNDVLFVHTSEGITME